MVPAMLEALLASRLVHKDATHGLSRGGEEMAAMFPFLLLFRVHQANIRFVHERRGFQCLTRRFPRQHAGCQPPQFLVDHWQQLFRSLLITAPNGVKDLGDVAHTCKVTSTSAGVQDTLHRCALHARQVILDLSGIQHIMLSNLPDFLILRHLVRVLLTGGYGCIGSWIARNLLDRGDHVCMYDLKQDLRRLRLVVPEERLPAIQFVQGDVTDLAGLRRALEQNGITHLVHLAGLQVPVCRADPLLGAKVNVVGTLVVFEAMRALREQVQRLVYASSAAVFGAPDDYSPGQLADDVPLSPATHYGVFKCCNEGNARIYFRDHGLSSVGLRPWTVYGVGRDFGMTSEPTKAIKSLALKRPYHITYGGWQDMQYVDDVARVFIRCLEAPYSGAKSYNLRGDVVDLPAFHRALCQVEPIAKDSITFGERQISIAYNLDDAVLQRDLGPMPKTPLLEGIRLTLEQFRQLDRQGKLDTADLDG